MKIALFTETYLPDVNGVAAHVNTLRDGLVKLGHEVLVVAADKHCKHHYIHDNVLHCPSVEVKRFYGFGMAPPYSRKRIKLVAQFNPDIIHIHHEFGIGLSGIFASKKLKLPLIYTLHTMYDQYIYYIAPRPLHQTATKISHRYERFIAHQANALTGPSAKCDEYFKRIGVKKELSVIPNSADLESFTLEALSAEERRAGLEKLGIPPDRKVACFVGRLGHEKSVDILLDYWAEAVTREDNLHLLVIGGGPIMEDLIAQAKQLGIADMVTFAGQISHDQMPGYYKLCDIYVTASLSDTNSISMLEGMATGLPTLQRYDELNKNQIQDGINGYMFNSAPQMAEQLRRLAALEGEEKEELQRRVRQSVINQGSTDLANYILGVYQRAIDEKQRNPAR